MAAWSASEQPSTMWKTHTDLTLRNGTALQLNGCRSFRIQGVPGEYHIRPEDQAGSEAARRKVLRY